MQKYFPESGHVSALNISQLSDYEIWSYAKRHHYSIVTKDKDFYHLAVSKGHPPKVIWIISGNCRNEEILRILLKSKKDIHRFLKNKKDLLILK